MQRSLSRGSREIEPDTGQWEWCTGIMRMSLFRAIAFHHMMVMEECDKEMGWPMLGPQCVGNGK
jgi:hypothetical protein